MTTATVLTLHLAVLIGLYGSPPALGGLTRPRPLERAGRRVRALAGLDLSVAGFVAFAIGAHDRRLSTTLDRSARDPRQPGRLGRARRGAAAARPPRRLVRRSRRPFLQLSARLRDRRDPVRRPPARRRPHRPRRSPSSLKKDTHDGRRPRPHRASRSPPARSAAAARSMSARCSVAMREIDLEPTSGEPPLRVYDCSGPYTDPEARDRHHGRPRRAPPRLDPRPRRRRGGGAARGPARG